MKLKGFSTKAVHLGEARDPSTNSIVTPIYQTATFGFASTRELLDVMRGSKAGNVYSRWWNPTVMAVERKLAQLEGTEDAMMFTSGMSAISSAVMTIVSKGDHVVAVRDLYGGTYELFTLILPRFGVETTLVDTTNLSDMSRSLRRNTRLIYAETPTNPTLRVVDLKAVSRLARRIGAYVAVDNTFASPYNQQPAKFGAHVILHSATKYLSGHSDLIAGAVASSKAIVKRIWQTRKILGGSLDPHAAWLLLRGIKTLGLRMERHNENGLRVAEFLESNSKVERVYYPGLKNHPHHLIAKRQMRGFGGMVSFEPKGNARTASRVVDRLKLAQIAPSLGGVETLASQPWTLSHYYMKKRDREKAGISDRLIRLSIGIEDPEDIIADLDQALRAVR